MTKSTLMILLGAATASSWWAFAKWPMMIVNNVEQVSVLVVPCGLLSAAVIALVIFESINNTLNK